MVQSLEARKQELRRWVEAELGAALQPASAAAIERGVRDLLSAAGARHVALYVALRNEVGLDGLLEKFCAQGVRTALPRVDGAQLALHWVVPGERLRRGPLGVREPTLDAPLAQISLLDAFVVPGLCFDRAGRRLGRGRGYYDWLLERARPDALRVGVCRSEFVIAQVPVGPRDQPMNYVITERENIRAEARGG